MWPERKADHAPLPSSANVKNTWNYTSAPHTSNGVVLDEAKGQLHLSAYVALTPREKVAV
jgi:hypothetical protein